MPLLPHRNTPLRSLLPVLAALSGAVAGTAQTPPWQEFRSPDGSRFLLLSTPGPDVIHWAVATPASALEDPVGYAGLAAATMACSLTGTPEIGSLDPEREPEVLDRLDALETEVARTILAGQEVEARTHAELQRLGDLARRLADPNAWERMLRAAPADDVTVEVVGGAGLLQLTTNLSGLRRVGEMLVDRREHAALRGVGDAFYRERLARHAAWTGDVLAPLRAEAASLALLGHPLQAMTVSSSGVRKVERALAQRVWQRTQHPSRTTHVLVGGFDAAAVREALEEIFSGTDLPRPATPEIPPLQPPAAARRSALPDAPRAAVVTALPLPPAATTPMARVVGRWLAGGDDSFVARALRAAGFSAPRVAVRVPHPPGLGPHCRHGLLLVEVLTHPEDPRRDEVDALRQAVGQALDAARKENPAPGDLRAHAAAIDAGRVRARRHAAGLARYLALHCGYRGEGLVEAMGPYPVPDPERARAFLNLTLAPERRVEVAWRPAR